MSTASSDEPSPVTWRILFALYLWCPRSPGKETSLEDHQRKMLYHHWYEGMACCTDVEALPPNVLRHIGDE